MEKNYLAYLISSPTQTFLNVEAYLFKSHDFGLVAEAVSYSKVGPQRQTARSFSIRI